MKLEVNIDKKYFLIVLGVIFLLAGSLVYAYGTSNPVNFGHTSGEISGALSLTDCHWIGGKRCDGCRYDWNCPSGEVAVSVGQRSTGETHIDYTYVKCCKIGF